MTPISFEQANCVFGRPKNLEESQCMSVEAYKGVIDKGSLDGSNIIIVAWKPSKQEIEEINKGNPIFLSCINGLPPHFLTSSFEQAINVG